MEDYLRANNHTHSSARVPAWMCGCVRACLCCSCKSARTSPYEAGYREPGDRDRAQWLGNGTFHTGRKWNFPRLHTGPQATQADSDTTTRIPLTRIPWLWYYDSDTVIRIPWPKYRDSDTMTWIPWLGYRDSDALRLTTEYPRWPPPPRPHPGYRQASLHASARARAGPTVVQRSLGPTPATPE